MSRLAAHPAEASAPGRAPAPALRALTVVALLLATLGAFSGVVRNGWFDVDDNAYVLDNPHVKSGLSAANVRWELTHPDVGNWSPVTMVSHMLDVQVFGLRPGAHHAVSLGWHALNAVLLLLVLYGYTGAWWRSACVAALFALHPLRVEAVAWAADRKDLVSACFFLLTLDAWRRWTRHPSAARYAGVCALLWLGLLSKPVLVTTPFVLLLLDAWPLQRLAFGPGADASGRRWRARVIEKWPLWLSIGAFSALTFRTQRTVGALQIIPGLTFPLRASNALRTYVIYVRDSAWPRHLSAYVPHDLQPHTLAAVAAFLALVLVTVLVVRLPRRPWLAVGWFWYVGMLVPMINFVQVGPHARADRFTYLPAIGLAVMLVWEVAERAGRSRATRLGAAAAALAATLALGVASARQVAHWRSTRTMYEWILRVNPGNLTIRWWLADLYLHDREPARALPLYERVIRELPSRTSLHTNLAATLAALQRLPEARRELAHVVAEAPAADAWSNLGRMDARLGATSAAKTEFDSALARSPADASTRVALAMVLLGEGDTDGAARHLALAVAAAPHQVEYRRVFAETLKRRGRYAEALAQYEAIVAARPGDVNALLNAAWMRATLPDAALRDGAAAVRMAEQAMRAAPAPTAVLAATCAAAYAEAGRWPDALAAADDAVGLARAAGSGAEEAEYARQRASYAAHRPWRGVPQ